MKDFNERAEQAAEMFLSRRGYDILERTWETEGDESPIDIVAKDEADGIVFVTVRARKGAEKGFPESNLDREALEKFAVKWFTAHPDDCVDCPFRFDVVALITLTESRAMIRHHINCMSVSCDINDPEEE